MGRTCWDKGIDTLVVITVLAGVVCAIFAAIFANNVGVKQTYLIGVTNGPPLMRGILVTDSESDSISYDLKYHNTLAPIMSLALVGPIDINTGDGPVFIALCGLPSLIVCDTTIPNTLSGSIRETSPGGDSLRVKIQDLRANRMDYEFRVMTPSNPAVFTSKLPSGGAQ